MTVAARGDLAITPEQCRAARALLNWSQPDLAKAAGTGRSSIANFERGARTPHPRNLKTLRATLEAADVEFIPENGGGPGVRLKRAKGK